jgi:hypothetical protein
MAFVFDEEFQEVREIDAVLDDEYAVLCTRPGMFWHTRGGNVKGTNPYNEGEVLAEDNRNLGGMQQWRPLHDRSPLIAIEAKKNQ